MTSWLNECKLESMPKLAVDELMDLIEIAEDKNKIALIDLLRLIICHE